MNFSNFTLILTTDCNYHCSYCYQKKAKIYLDGSCIEKALDFFFPYFKNECYLTFYGGEPLLATDGIMAAVEQMERLEKKQKKNIRFSITTNGSLLSDETINFLCEKNFFVLLSFDAAAQDGKQKGSHEFLVSVLDKLLKCNSIELGTNSVFIPATIDLLLPSALYLINKGVPRIDLSFSTLTSWDNDSLYKMDRALASLREYLLDHYKEQGKIPITNFSKMEGKKVFSCGAGTENMALSPDGYLWGCSFFYDLARRQGEPLLKNSFCFGEVDEFKKNMNSIYPKVLEEYKPLKMEYFFAEEMFCQFCPDLKDCAVCPAEAAFSTNIIGMIPAHSCQLRKVIRRQVKEFWAAINNNKQEKM